MSGFTMIADEDYEQASGTREEQFVSLARAARISLNKFIEQDRDYGSRDHSDIDAIKSQFIGEIEGLAEELGISDLHQDVQVGSARYDQVQQLISKLSAKYRIRTKRANNDSSIQISVKNRAWIRQELGHLRTYIDEADLPKWKKKELFAKIDEALKSLDRERFSYASIMPIIVQVSAVFGTSMTGLAQAPKAIETIHHVIQRLGDEYARNEEQQLLLEGPRLEIEDKSEDILNDDVPF